MLIILPPSETKSHGGDGAPLDWAQLSFPDLNVARRAIARDLVALSADTDASLAVLGISEALREEVASNAELLTSPTMPAILRYTGVLYDALDAVSLPKSAWERLTVGSALFGVVAAGDPIPRYRLSGGTKLPEGGAEAGSAGAAPTMKARWGEAITRALEEVEARDGLVVDLRSGAYQQLGKLRSAITVRVESVQADGSRKVVSHFNKHYKGQLARVLATCDQADEEITGIEDIAAIAQAAGLTTELPAASSKRPHELTLVVEPETQNK